MKSRESFRIGGGTLEKLRKRKRGFDWIASLTVDTGVEHSIDLLLLIVAGGELFRYQTLANDQTDDRILCDPSKNIKKKLDLTQLQKRRRLMYDPL